MGPVIPLASLLADPELTAVYPTTTVNNDTITHNGIKESGSWATTNSLKNGIFEISASQVGVVQSSENHTRPPQISVRELDGSKISHFQVSASQVGIGQIGTTQFSLGQISTAQIGSSQINVSQASSGQVSSTEVNTAQNILGGVVVRDISNPQNSPTQVNSREISLPFLVTPVQFFNIHNSSLTSINTYKDNSPTLWSTLFDPTNPFDLTFQIEDLPTGQLAEAQITKYDQYGRPNGGLVVYEAETLIQQGF